MNFSPFSCPIFLGHPEARGRCSQGERVLYGRDLCRSGETGKAEIAKSPGAGIWPEAVPRKMRGRKRLAYRTRPESIRGADLLHPVFHIDIKTRNRRGMYIRVTTPVFLFGIPTTADAFVRANQKAFSHREMTS